MLRSTGKQSVKSVEESVTSEFLLLTFLFTVYQLSAVCWLLLVVNFFNEYDSRTGQFGSFFAAFFIFL